MKKLRSNLIGIENGSLVLFTDYIDGGEMWSGDGEREFRKRVNFSEPFATPPNVMVGISLWDFDSETNQRADISAVSVTRKGFAILFKTWGDTRIARIRAEWSAFGELEDDESWELY